MKVAAIIAEFNPFTKGHEYIIKKAKEITDSDYIIVVMSGNYVQRGEPAVCDKYLRTKMALECGADLVIELPVVYSCASAEYFAKGAVSLIERLGLVDFLCFGAENDDLNALSDIAEILLKEPEEYKDILKEMLKSGISFPAARAAALSQYVFSDNESSKILYPDLINEIVSSSNNILAIEYLKALMAFKSNIVPVAVKRIGADYNDSTVNASSDNFASASAVRKALCENNLVGVLKSVPLNCNEILDQNRGKKLPISLDDFSLILGAKLLECKSAEDLEDYLDVNNDFANKILKNRSSFTSFSGFAEMLKSKNNTLTAINRALLHIMLGIKSDYLNQLAKSGYHEYVRILGFKKDATSELMAAVKFGCNLPIITKMADFEGSPLMDLNIAADNIYSLVVRNKFENKQLKNEFNSGLTMI
ncbi:MAG: nucleotidyltransferase [Lachnospiraceae bacterium]|nr:nucleotidyltransferase [Lachnospiraceae bacterium]